MFNIAALRLLGFKNLWFVIRDIEMILTGG